MHTAGSSSSNDHMMKGSSTPSSRNRDMLVAALVFNIALLNTFSISAVANTEDASLFSYGWTFRLRSKDTGGNMALAKEAISKMYIDNRVSSKPELGLMLDEIFSVAKCRPAVYDGGLEWSAEEVSPTCNCLRNMHVEYIKSINPNAKNLTLDEMGNEDTRTKTLAVVTAIQRKCFDAIRHTQIEDMTDPMMPETSNTLLQTNVVANVLYWNVIGSTFSLFMFLFEGYLHMSRGGASDSSSGGGGVMAAHHQNHPRRNHHNEGGDSFPQHSAAAPITIMGYKSFTDMFMLLVVVACIILIGWNLIIPFFFVTPVYGVGMLVIPIIFMVYALYHVMLESRDMEKNNPYPARKRLVFWTAYTISVPFIAQCMDMLLQRRDWVLNWTVFFSIIVVGLCSLAIEMVQTSFEYAVVNNNNNGGGEAEASYSDVALRNFYNSKNMMILIIMFCTGIITVAVCLATFPVFPATPFSNACMTIVLVSFLLTLPLISSARHLVESHDKAVSQQFGSNIGFWDTWSMELGTMELAARCIFTLAVVCDIWSVRTVDNINIGI